MLATAPTPTTSELVGVPTTATTGATTARRRPGREVLPGLAFVGAFVAVAMVASRWVDNVSPLVIAVALGALTANTGVTPAAAAPGIRFAARPLLRAGVALLGFQLSLAEVVSLGPTELVMVVGVVATTFFATQWLGRRLGLGEDLSLLVATGYSICGASAIAAMDDVAHAEEEDVAVAIALVTLCGTLAIAVLPLLRGPLGLDDPGTFGAWVGASVHDVGQVVATASSGGAESLHTAVLVKLTRIVMLAPIVVLVASRLRNQPAATTGDGIVDSAPVARPPLVPMFMVGFLAALALRSTGMVPASVLGNIEQVKTVLLAAGLFALGAGVRIAKLRTVGPRPFLLGLGSWVVIAGVSYAGVLLTR